MNKSFFDKNWVVYKIMDEHIREAAKKFANGRLLDIGYGEKPLQNMFAPYVTEHIGLDYQDSLHSKDNVDLFGPAYEIPKENKLRISVATMESFRKPDFLIVTKKELW